MLRTLARRRSDRRELGAASACRPLAARLLASWRGADLEMEEIAALDRATASGFLRVLHHDGGLPPSLVPHVIPLLAWDPVADDAVRRAAEGGRGAGRRAHRRAPRSEPAVRRPPACWRACSRSATSQRAADGLLLGLDDLRFEVRFQCGRSLAAIVEKNPQIRIDRERIFEVVLREVAVGRPVWESHRLLDRLDEPEQDVFVDEFVKDRASQSLAHVFTLLSLVLPAEPLQIAFRGLHTDDQNLRGTALEYLEGVLPPAIRDRLWPFLEDHAPARTRDAGLETKFWPTCCDRTSRSC